MDNLLKDTSGNNIKVQDQRNLLEIINAPKLKKTRELMIKGEIPSFCTRCFDIEASGGESRRILENKYYDQHIDQALKNSNPDGTLLKPNVLSADYRLGNTCNLKCLMCSPIATKQWIETWNDSSFEKISNDKLEELKNLNWHESTVFEDVVLAISQGLENIHFAGGEPFLIKNIKRILNKLVDENLASGISLSFNTNLTVIPEWISILSKFKKTNICVSIDGVGKVNDYIRRFSNWDTIFKNLKYIDAKYNDLNLDIFNISCTVQVLNILHLNSLFELPKLFLNMQKKPLLFNLHHPEYLSSHLISKDLKNKVERMYKDIESSQIQSVLTHLKNEPAKNLGIKFLKFVEKNESAGYDFFSLNPALNKEMFLF